MCSCNVVFTSTKAETCECRVDSGEYLIRSTDWGVDTRGLSSLTLMHQSGSPVSGTEFSQTVSGLLEFLPPPAGFSVAMTGGVLRFCIQEGALDDLE